MLMKWMVSSGFLLTWAYTCTRRIQRWHRYYIKFPELYSRCINSLTITAINTWLNTKVWNKLPFGFLIREFDHFLPQPFPPFLINYLLSRDTVSFFLKFFLSIWNFMNSGISGGSSTLRGVYTIHSGPYPPLIIDNPPWLSLCVWSGT